MAFVHDDGMALLEECKDDHQLWTARGEAPGFLRRKLRARTFWVSLSAAALLAGALLWRSWGLASTRGEVRGVEQKYGAAVPAAAGIAPPLPAKPAPVVPVVPALQQQAAVPRLPPAVAAAAAAAPDGKLLTMNGYMLVGRQWVIMPVTTTLTATTTSLCLTAKAGSKCHSAIIWTKYTGMNLHTDWYHGIGSNSTLEEIQTYLASKGEAECKTPCPGSTVLRPSPVWGKPSFFCFSVMRPGYEQQILEMQMSKAVGIFACEEQRIFSNVKVVLGGEPPVDTIVIPNFNNGISQDGTSANTGTFLAVWSIVKADQTYQRHDFSVKADPDAVIIPDRLRQHMAPHASEVCFVRNCNKVPGSPNFPMMFGSVEVLSRIAVDTYLGNEASCKGLPWNNWGEDYFMGKCLQMIGVVPIDDFNIVKDGACSGVWCNDGWTAAFHPFKSVEAWESCYKTAIATPAGPR